MKRIVSVLLVVLTTALFADSGRIVRVGYYSEPGMMDGAEPGAAKSGYAYEYLQEIASHAGWRFEYAYGSFDELYRKLKNGEIDLMPYVNYSETRAKEISFPELAMGEEKFFLASKNRVVVDSELTQVVGRKVGTSRGTFDRFPFIKMMEDRKLAYTIVDFDTSEQCWEALMAGTVDYTIESSSMHQHVDLHAALEIPGEHPYYLAVAPRRKDILAELNFAVHECAKDDPGFLYELKFKYFNKVPLFKMLPAASEKWLREHEVIRIGTFDNQLPFVYLDAAGKITGMAPDCVRLMFDSLGVKTPVEWSVFGGRAEALSALRAGEIDLIHPYYHGYADAERDGVIISSSVYDAPFGILYRGDYTADTLAKVATPATRLGLQHMRDKYPRSECVGCRDGYDCIDRLLAGEVNSVVMYMPTLQAIAAKFEENFNIKALCTPCAVCFAALPKDAALIGLVNKSVPYVDAVALNEIENRHSIAESTRVSFREFLRQNAVWLYAVSVIPLVVLLIVGYLLMRSKRERELRELAEKSNAALNEHNVRMLALSDDFAALYDVEIATGDYDFFVKGQRFADHVSSKLVEKHEFFSDAQKNIELAVRPEYRDSIRSFMTRDFILSALERNSHFEWHYQLDVNGRPEWYRMRIVYKDDSKRNFLLGVFSAQAEMEAKEKEREEFRRKELEEEKTRFEVVQGVLHSAQWHFKIGADDRITDWEYSSDVGQLVKNPKAAESYDWKELTHPEDLPSLLAAFQAAVADHTCRTPYDVTFRMIDEKGDYNWFRSCGRMIRHEDGTGDFIGIHIDVTERVMKERSAAAKEQLITDIMLKVYGYNNNVDLDDGHCNIIVGSGSDDAKKTLMAATGYRDAYDKMMARIRPEYHDRLRRLLSLDYLRANCGHRGFYGSEIYETLDDDPKWGEVNVIFSVNEKGHTVANVLGRDITEQRREAARLEREMKAAQAKDQIISGITMAMFGFNITVDLKRNKFSLIKGAGTDLICNVFEACREKSYTDATDILLGHVPDDYKAATIETIGRDVLLKRAGENGFLGTKQLPWHGSDDADHWVELNSFMAVNSAGEPLVNILGRDVTAERNEQERLQSLEREAAQAKIDAAEETSRAKTAFLANMSHDIRTPMNAIIGFSDIARRHIHEPEKVAEYLDRVQLAGSNLLEIINDILDLSKIDSQKVEITEYPAWISRMPKYFYTICSLKAKEKDIRLICETGEYRDETLWIDKPHLNRIVLNLLTNSIKYTPDGGAIRFCVSQLPDRKEGYATICIEIQDNGIGMSKEYLAHIFERFTRERNSTMSGIQGTGIGMSITKLLTDALGGTISVESKENVGTKFTLVFDFRRRRDGEGEMEENEELRTKNEEADDGSAKRILLVEDNEINREIGIEILNGAGFKVDFAVNGKEAVEKVCGPMAVDGNRQQSADGSRQQSTAVGSGYDLILMDIMMPEMNGLEAAKAIRAAGIEVPIVALSANAFTEDRNASIAAGMNDHLAKPIKVKPLLEMIRKFIG